MIPYHFGWKRLEKVWNDKNYAFQIILDPFGGKRLGKVWNNQNWAFQIILDQFGGKRLEKVQNNQNCTFQIILNHFGRKRRWGKVQNNQNWVVWMILLNMQMRSSLSMLSRPLDQCIWHRSLYQSNKLLSGLVIRLVYLQRSLSTSLVYMLTCPQQQQQCWHWCQQPHPNEQLVIAQLTAVLKMQRIL